MAGEVIQGFERPQYEKVNGRGQTLVCTRCGSVIGNLGADDDRFMQLHDAWHEQVESGR